MKTMWFVSAHIPLPEQIKQAEEMGYKLVHIKSPVIERNDSPLTIQYHWVNLLSQIPITESDAIVVMGEPRWVVAIALMAINHEMIENTDGKLVNLSFVQLYTTFSERKVEEVKQPDGSVKKISVFRHVKFVELF